MRILLVDDHQVFREGLKSLLADEVDLEVVGEAHSARAAIQAVMETRPDLAVIDLILAGTSGVSLTREIRRLSRGVRILILTALTEVSVVGDALAAGAQGYALKEQSMADLALAIRTVGRGGSYLAPRFDASLLTEAPKSEGIITRLSRREREVFDMIVRGYGNQRISKELFVSVKTIETHRTHINRKLHTHSTGELVRFAALTGLLPESGVSRPLSAPEKQQGDAQE